ncbi:winged helix-turn-helix domain-containing protein, partial [Brevibacterium paucivorans]
GAFRESKPDLVLLDLMLPGKDGMEVCREIRRESDVPIITREQLLEEVWGYQHSADTRLVNVHVQRLRSKIERDPENPEIVVTVRGVGYRAGRAA